MGSGSSASYGSDLSSSLQKLPETATKQMNYKSANQPVAGVRHITFRTSTQTKPSDRPGRHPPKYIQNAWSLLPTGPEQDDLRALFRTFQNCVFHSRAQVHGLLASSLPISL